MAERRRGDEPDVDPAVALEREQRRPRRDAAHVVPRAVDRVDDPARGAAVVAELLAEHALAVRARATRSRMASSAARSASRDRRQVGLRLDSQVERAEPRERDRVGGIGKLVREAKIGAHGVTLSTRR